MFSLIAGCRWRTESASGEVGIEHSHHCIADLLRELTSPHLFAWQCLSPIAGIADLGAEGTQPIRIIEGLDHHWINRFQQNEQPPDDVGLWKLDLAPGEESLQVLLRAC